MGYELGEKSIVIHRAFRNWGWTYSYDYENRLTRVAQPGTTKQQNYYDGDGERVKQVAGSSTFTYSYQGLNIPYEKNVTGSTTTITKHFYAGGLQVAKMVGTGVYYLHQDALGSMRLVTTSTVSIKFSPNYVPYESNYAISGKVVFMFTGKPYDSATGLYYYGARYYDTKTGRFITQDSYSGDHNDPMTMNLYVYARDNPEKYTDPNGHYFHSSYTTCGGGKCTTTSVMYSGGQVTTSTIVSKDVVTVVPAPDNPRPGDTGADWQPVASTSSASTASTTTTTQPSLACSRFGCKSSGATNEFSFPSDWGTRAEAAVLVGVLTVPAVVMTISPYALPIQVGLATSTGPLAPFLVPAIDAGIAGGTRGMWTYVLSNPSHPTPQDVANAYVNGFAQGFVFWLNSILP